MKKRLISVILAISMMVCMCNFVYVQGEENGDSNISLPEFQDKATEPPFETMQEAAATPEASGLQETVSTPTSNTENNFYNEQSVRFTAEPVSETPKTDENKEHILSDADNYTVTQLSNDEYIAKDIISRDAEIYITDGYRPIQNAEVRLLDNVKVSDSNGKVLIEDIPTSEDSYLVTVNSKEYGEKSINVVFPDTEKLTDNDEPISKSKITISYWENSATETELFSNDSKDIKMNERWEYNNGLGEESGGKVIPYNGLLYVLGEGYFKVYNPITNIWAELTSISGLNNILTFYEGKIYIMNSWWQPNGDNQWKAPYELYTYDLDTNNWSIVCHGNSGGLFNSTAIGCNDKIYFIGGSYIAYDMDMLEENLSIQTYDINNKTMSYIGYTESGDNKTILYEKPGKYYRNIFCFERTGGVTRIDTSSNTVHYSSLKFNYYDGQSVTLVDNKAYIIGGRNADNTSVQTYDLENDICTLENNMPNGHYNHSANECNGNIYVLGGTGTETSIDIYNTKTNSWIAGSSLNMNVLNDSAAIIGGKLYAMFSNGILGIYKLEYIWPEETKSGVSTGINHIVRLNDGIVQAYGDNTFGQLGTGDTDKRDNFTDVIATWGNKEIIKLETRGNTTFALTSDNILYGWGDNSKGQLGNGTTQNESEPVQIRTGVKDIKAGLDHTVVLDTNRRVYAWGSNEYNQINSSNNKIILTPYMITDYSELIGAGDYQTYYHGTDFELRGIGKNEKGMISNKLYSLFYIQKISCGNNHAAAIDLNGQLWVWGDNSKGQLGTILSNGESYTMEPVNTGIYADNIYAGENITAYIEGGQVYQSGNIYGEINNEFKRVENPVGIVDISLGNTFSVGIDANDNLWRWGKMTNNDGFSDIQANNPLKIEYDYAFSQVDSYRNQSLAIDELGQVLAWGEGYYADGSDSMKTCTYPIKIDGIDNPLQVSRGKNHNLVLDKNGDVWGWGSNSNNPMGDLPGKVKTVSKLNDISKVQQIAAGTEFSVFLKKDGTLWGVGKNDKGQLGQGTSSNSNIPVRITEKSDFKKISVGEDYVAALAGDGIYTWGGNGKGQLGDGTVVSNKVPAKLSVDLADNEHLTDISAGIDFCLALTNLGNVYAWGDNANGELGQHGTYKTPTKINTLTNISKISAGKKSALAIKNDGTVYGWGYGYDGQLGVYANSEFTPKVINSLSGKNINSISCGYNFSVALDIDGNVYSFGNNEYGQLGIFTNSARLYANNKEAISETVEGIEDGMAKKWYYGPVRRRICSEICFKKSCRI